MDGVKGCLNGRELTIPEAKECVKDKREWKRIVRGRRRCSRVKQVKAVP